MSVVQSIISFIYTWHPSSAEERNQKNKGTFTKWSSPQIKESTARFKVLTKNVIRCWTNGKTVLGSVGVLWGRRAAVTVSIYIPFLHSFFFSYFGRNRARIMFKEEPSVCGTQHTTHLGQGEKAKTKKFKQKGICFHKRCHKTLMQRIKKSKASRILGSSGKP